MQDIPILVLDAVLNAVVVARFFQAPDQLTEAFFVLAHYRGRDRIKSVLLHLPL